MSSHDLESFLRRKAGEEELEFVVPYALLPPRYQKGAAGRNLLVVLDRDVTINLRWEGSRLGEWLSITKGEMRQLSRDVLRRLKQYSLDLKIFSQIIDEKAEAPFQDPIYAKPAPEIDAAATAKNIYQVSAPTSIRGAEGGETPLPTADY